MRTSSKPFLFGKAPTFTVQEPFCRSTRMSFLPLRFQRRCFAHIIAKSYPIRTVIQLLSTSGLICPSISSQREGLKIQPFQKLFYLTSKIFDFMHSFLKKGKTKKPLHRHQESAGALLSLQNDVLCNGFEIQRRDCLFICSLADSTKKHRVQTAVFSLSIPQALGGLHRILNRNILYLVVTSFIGTLLYQTPRRKSSLW